jgi:hypothetical protein
MALLDQERRKAGQPLGGYKATSTSIAQSRIWQSMRVLLRFDSGDLVVTTEATDRTVQTYLRALHRAGYVRMLKRQAGGRPGSRSLYQLVRDSGPLAPVVRQDGSGVWDQNTQQLHVQGERVFPPPYKHPPRAASGRKG